MFWHSFRKFRPKRPLPEDDFARLLECVRDREWRRKHLNEKRLPVHPVFFVTMMLVALGGLHVIWTLLAQGDVIFAVNVGIIGGVLWLAAWTFW